MNIRVVGVGENRGDQSGDLPHLLLAHAHGRHRWRAQANPAYDGRIARVARHYVEVRNDACFCLGSA